MTASATTILDNIRKAQEVINSLPADVPARVDVGSMERLLQAFPPVDGCQSLDGVVAGLGGIPVYVDAGLPEWLFIVKNRQGHIILVGSLDG